MPPSPRSGKGVQIDGQMGRRMGEQMDGCMDKRLLNQAVKWEGREQKEEYKLRSPRESVKENVSMCSCRGAKQECSHHL